MNESLLDYLKTCTKNSQSCPTLLQLSLNKIALSLWKAQDKQLQRGYTEVSTFYRAPLVNSQNSILASLKFLCIPYKLQHQLEYVIEMTACGIISLMSHLSNFGWHHWTSLDFTVWTPHGALDIRKSVCRVLNKEDIEFGIKISLAAHHGFEEEMKCLWKKLPHVIEDWKAGKIIIDLSPVATMQLFDYWRSFVSGADVESNKVYDICSSYIFADRATAVDYFWRKMSVQERDRLIRERFESDRDHLLQDLLYFILTHATEEQLSVIVESQRNRCRILSNLLFPTRPWMRYFLSPQLVSYAGDDEIINRFMQSMYYCKQNIHKKPLEVLWNNSSGCQRSKMLKTFSMNFDKQVKTRQLEILRVMLKDVDKQERFEFLCNLVPVMLYQIVRKCDEIEWGSFVEDVLECPDYVKMFREVFAEYGMAMVSYWEVQEEYKLHFDYRFWFDPRTRGKRTEISMKDVLDGFGHSYEVDFDLFFIWCLMSNEEKEVFKNTSVISG